jgi:glycosyltransferase involved in cell wall biosynthesis
MTATAPAFISQAEQQVITSTGPVRLSIIIPTISNPLLENTFKSIAYQNSDLHPEDGIDEALVIGDGPQAFARSLAEDYNTMLGVDLFKYREGPSSHQYGNAQRNFAIPKATGDYLVFMDEDDIFTENAFLNIKKHIRENRGKPLLFRFETFGRMVLWQFQGDIGLGRTGGHQTVFPNIPDKLGRWVPENDYCADWSYVNSTLALYPNGLNDVIYCDYIIADARPHTKRSAQWYDS